MLTKEEYKKEFIRMIDSVRDTESKHFGEFNCHDVECSECGIGDACGVRGASPFDTIEAVEQWAKEHLIVTNADKFKEVFGREPQASPGNYYCPYAFVGDKGCTTVNCDTCKKDFWKAEYKEPKKSEEVESGIEKRKEWSHKPCINYEDGCEEWAGCPCVYYKAESENKE